MALPGQKISRDLDGDTPEQVAWGLLEWIRQVENVRDREGILGAFSAGLTAAREGIALVAMDGAVPPATGPQRRLAYKLAHLVAELEGRDIGQRNQGDRSWILGCYAECLEAVMGRRQAIAAIAAEAVAS